MHQQQCKSCLLFFSIFQDQRGWWFSRENDYFKADDVSDCDKGFEGSLELIQRTFDLHGPFDGVMGFSQGAALLALLCLIKTRRPELLSPSVKFDFAIMKVYLVGLALLLIEV